MFVHVVIKPRIRFGTSEVFSLWYFGGLKGCIWLFWVSPLCPRSMEITYLVVPQILLCWNRTNSNLQRTAYHHFHTLFQLSNEQPDTFFQPKYYSIAREKVQTTLQNHQLHHQRETRHQSQETQIYLFRGIWTVKNLIFVLLRKISSIILENRHWDL